jgi:hypothetical protein
MVHILNKQQQKQYKQANKTPKTRTPEILRSDGYIYYMDDIGGTMDKCLFQNSSRCTY